MVRMRCDMVEDEEPDSARAKLRATLETYLPDPEERAWVEPRLGHLLGLEEGVPGDQENLFSAWRVLFERIAEEAPTVLVFEDLQWADSGLLDFVEYLLDWSRGHPIFVLALARPEFAERRPGWGAGKRSFSALYLEPLSTSAMGELLDGLVPGLPDDLRERILGRAEGVPLYAVETVRMLLDHGLLAKEGNVYRATGDVESLNVPDTLHALVAARLDALPFEERRLVECGAVLGKTFTRPGLSVVSGVAENKLDTLLAGLLGKEILSVQADPRSPERGQYSFLQDIVKRVAYETISRRERKSLHLSAAEYLISTASGEEHDIVEVVAAHYLDAYASAPEDPDALDLKAKALEMLVRAAERAGSLGATAEAQRALERASELTDDPLAQASLLERAGMAAYVGARADEAAEHFARATGLFGDAGATHQAARVAARTAEISWDRGRLEQGLASMDQAFTVLSEDEPDADLAALAAQLGRFMFFAGQGEVALERLERALQIAERLALPETLANALNTKALVLTQRGRMVEAIGLIRLALQIALDHDKPSAALRAYYNLADISVQVDRATEAAENARAGLALARKVGNRYWEWAFLAMAYPAYVLGDWDDVAASEDGLPEDDWTRIRIAFATLLTSIVPVLVHRGQLAEAQAKRAFIAELAATDDQQELAQRHHAEAVLLVAEGRLEDGLASAAAGVECRATLGLAFEAVREAWVVAVDAALRLGRVDRAEELLTLVDSVPPHSLRFLHAQAERFRARMAADRGDVGGARSGFERSTGVFRELGYPFALAVVLLEHAEWADARGGDEAQPLAREARDVFAGLGAVPWLERAEQVLLETT